MDTTAAATPAQAAGSTRVGAPAARAVDPVGDRSAPAVVADASAPAAAADSSTTRSTPRLRGDRTGTAYRSRARVPEQADISDSLLASALTQQELTPDIEDIVAAIIGVLRTVAAASGLGADEVEQTVARTLAFMRRRLTGDYTCLLYTSRCV